MLMRKVDLFASGRYIRGTASYGPLYPMYWARNTLVLPAQGRMTAQVKSKSFYNGFLYKDWIPMFRLR